MSWALFTLIWGLGNIWLGILFDSIPIEMFGLGILLGGLAMAIDVDIEMFKEAKS